MLATRNAGRLVGVLLITWACSAGQNVPSNPDGSLTSLSMEELTNLTVSSVSRRDQQLSRVAAAAYIITDEEIRRSGVRSIPELLRRVPGLQVAQIDAHQWAVSARGFNGRFANKMLVLIDGRSVYNNEYSGVYWDQNDVLLEDVERIEVIRGPGATMWGANAVNGVINIITKKAKDTQGGLVVAQGGGDETVGAAVRYGGRRGDGLHYRAYAKGMDRQGLVDSRGATADDGWHSVRGGGRLDWEPDGRDLLTFSGDVYRGGGAQTVNRSFVTPFPVIGSDTVNFSGGYFMGRWERTLKRSDIALQTYYNDERRNEWIAGGSMQTFDFDFQQHADLNERHDLVWGVGYRWMHDALTGTNPPFLPPSSTEHLLSAFVQDDVTIIPNRFVVTLGSKILQNTYTGVELQPGVRVLWTPSRRRTLWASVARAVRTPSRRDRDLSMLFNLPAPGPLPMAMLVQGNKSFESETMLAYEGGYREQINRRMYLDVAVFYNNYEKLLLDSQQPPFTRTSPTPLLILPVTFTNSGWGHTYGVESSLSWTVNHRWKLLGGHAWTSARLFGPGVPGPADYQSWAWMTPRNTFSIQSTLDLNRRLSFDTSVYFVSRLPQRDIPAYARADMRLAWKVGEFGEISAGVQNLQPGTHQEFSMEEYTVPSLIARTAYLRALWRF